MTRILILGYGNPGRLDDGLGPAFAEAIAGKALPGVTAEADYQLAVEDAAAIAACDVVVFADAAVSGKEPFSFEPVKPSLALSFTSHSVEPATVLAMALEMFGASPRAFVLGIRGYEFSEFGERLSEGARHNLAAAVHFVEELIGANALGSDGAAPADTKPSPVVIRMTAQRFN